MRKLKTENGNICVGGSITINGSNITIINGKICECEGGNITHGNRKIVTSEVTLPAFESLANYGVPAEITFRQGPLAPARIKGDENILPLIHVAVDQNGTNLSIKTTGSFTTSSRIKIELQSPRPFREVLSEGSGNITLSNLDTEFLRIDLVGSSDIRVAGRAKRLDVVVCGSGDVDAEDLVAETADVSVNGSGDVSTNASDRCQVQIQGSGDVTVYGSPTQISSKVCGSGRVMSR